MKASILNKMSKEGREKIIELEGALRRLDEDLAELNLMLENLQCKRAIL